MLGGGIVIFFLTPVLGAQQAHGEIGNILLSLDVEDVYTTFVVLNFPTKRSSTKGTYYASHFLKHSVFHWVERDKALVSVDHAFGCMVVYSYEEGL